MQRKNTLTVNLNAIKPHLQFIILAIFFIIGIVIGSLFVGRFESLVAFFEDKVVSFYEIRKSFNFLTVFSNSLLNAMPYYLVVFLCGTSIIGCAVTPIVLILKGFFFGAFSGYMYFTYRLDGIMFNALLLIPTGVVCAFGLLLLAKESFSFSYLLSSICIKSGKTANIYSNFKTYCIKGLICSIFAVIAVFIDIGLSALFTGFFDF